eukprot:m.16524 g.16524  ORF g.16524 m.16524 type:complete len:253 (-) comp7646_c0_seq1:147-905(-)
MGVGDGTGSAALRSLSHELDGLWAADERLHDELNGLRRSLTNHRVQIGELEGDVDGLHRSLRRQDKEVEEIRAAIEGAAESMKRELAEVKQQHREDIQRLETAIQQLQTDLADLQGKEVRGSSWELIVARTFRKVAAKVVMRLDRDTRTFVGPFFRKYLMEAEQARLSGETDDEVQRAKEATQTILREQFHTRMSFDRFMEIAAISVARGDEPNTLPIAPSDSTILQQSPIDLRLTVGEMLRLYNSLYPNSL